jgi:molybdopterin converting factor small subunit
VGPKKLEGDVQTTIFKMEISVLFFGVLAEVTGCHHKHYRDIKSFGDLKHRIEDDFPEIVHYNFRIAVNNKIVNEEIFLSPGDEIACLPPFAGG